MNKFLVILMILTVSAKADHGHGENGDLSGLVVPVKNVDEVLKHALTKELKRVEWVEVEKIAPKKDQTSVSSTH